MCYDAEPLQMGKETFPSARKEYVCCECGSTIDIGEKHQCFTGLLDGVWVTFRTCIPCSKIRNVAQCKLCAHGEVIAFTCLYELVGSEFEEAAI